MITLDVEFVQNFPCPMDLAIIDQIVKVLVRLEQVLSAQLISDMDGFSKGNPATFADRHPAFDFLASSALSPFGYFNSALRRSDPRRCSDRWVFCSMRCMNAFSRVMERLTCVEEDAVIDPSDLEVAAMRAALALLGNFVTTIGMERSLFALYPAGKVRKGKFLIRDVLGSPGDSLEVVLDGDKSGLWTDRATGDGGDIVDLIARHHQIDTKSDFPKVMKLARDLTGRTTVIPPKKHKKEEHRSTSWASAPSNREDRANRVR